MLSTNGQSNTSGFGDLNGNAIAVAGEGRVRTDFFGLTGHQLLGTTFSNKKFTSIDQRLGSDVIENNALRPEKGSWNIYYNFDQYLYEPKKGVDRGVGLFGGWCFRRQSQLHEILRQLRRRRQRHVRTGPTISSDGASITLTSIIPGLTSTPPAFRVYLGT